ncbi:hypothetical protein ACFS5L_26615 [Streptomyces phyllanthi]|uniref:hypothetical protein n=1 Tax=Streptomyces phyllanthi TaxID=1803180 RepID=UPI001883596C|nr:hypothetical protein [Streptomyces phyllanthi]
MKDTSLLGYEAARDRVRTLSAGEGTTPPGPWTATPPGPRPGAVRGWLRRLLRR